MIRSVEPGQGAKHYKQKHAKGAQSAKLVTVAVAGLGETQGNAAARGQGRGPSGQATQSVFDAKKNY